MRKFGDCAFCAGSGKCEECDGTGANPQFNSPESACPHCSTSGKCPECGGSGLSPIGRFREGSVLKYAVFVVAVMAGVFALLSVPSRIVSVTGSILWVCLCWGVFRWNGKRRGPSPPSRF
jgi:hypothetical protein